MPQVHLLIFPAGSVEINRELACRVEGQQVICIESWQNGQRTRSGVRDRQGHLRDIGYACRRVEGPRSNDLCPVRAMTGGSAWPMSHFNTLASLPSSLHDSWIIWIEH